ncbi:MAG: LamG-like jellyroll fold domain-containing protein, partial [Verrucomicrobiota bacterium]
NTLNSLLFGLDYAYRVYASNAMGTAWAPVSSSFNTLLPTGPLPSHYSGLDLWLNGSTIGSNDADVVGFWPDDSGRDHHIDRLAGGGSDPKYRVSQINGQPAVRYDGNDYQYSTHSFTGLTAYTIFSVARYLTTEAASSDRVICSRDNNFLFGFYAQSTENWYAGGWIQQGGDLNTDWHVHIGTLTDDPDPLAAFWTDGNLMTTNNTSSEIPHVPGRLALGARNNNNDKASKAAIAEVIIYDRVLSDAELLDIAGYLGGKYAIPTALPISIFQQVGIDAISVTGITGHAAMLEADMNLPESVFEVVAYYGPTDGGTDPGAWSNSVAIGSYTNHNVINVSGMATGLNYLTPYFYTFVLQNSATTIWASASSSFVTTEDTAVVQTGPASNLTAVSAGVGGTVLDNGGDDPEIVMYYGLTDAGPAFGWDDSVSFGIQSGSFTGLLSGLDHSSVYYYRAYAMNVAGGAWALNSGSFTTLPAVLPTVQTLPATNIGANVAVLQGEVTDIGNHIPNLTIYYGTADEGTNA